jgi:hypothetical protein
VYTFFLFNLQRFVLAVMKHEMPRTGVCDGIGSQAPKVKCQFSILIGQKEAS